MVTWDIQRGGRAWGDEAMSRYQMIPEKTETVGGRLYGTEEERLTMLALLLENVGADKAATAPIIAADPTPTSHCEG